MFPLATGAYIESMKLDETGVLRNEMRSGPAPPPPLDIVIGTKGARSRERFPEKKIAYMVVAFPEDEAKRFLPTFKTFGQTQRGGRFEYRASAPATTGS